MCSAHEDKNNVTGGRLGAYQPKRTQDIKSNQLKALIKMSPGNRIFLNKKKIKKSVIAQGKIIGLFYSNFIRYTLCVGVCMCVLKDVHAL